METQRLFDLAGKRALVTGGGGGIGFACAQALAQQGADIVLADISAEKVQARAGELAGSGFSAQGLVCNVADPDNVNRMMEQVAAKGGVDILIHSAAITERKDVLDMADDEWTAIVDVNLNGAYRVSKAAARQMVDQGRGGSMVFIVSTGAYRASGNFGAYSASKAGVVMLMKTLALELARHGIRANAIAPTVTDTDFIAGHYRQYPEKREAAIRNHPLGRIAQPEDYMGTAVYLCSPASAFVTGSLLVVDGGKTAK